MLKLTALIDHRLLFFGTIELAFRERDFRDKAQIGEGESAL